MALPFFYIQSYLPGQTSLVLDEINSRHAIQVLRMSLGQSLHLTDGKGHLLTAIISNPHKKGCEVTIHQQEFLPAPPKKVTLAISLLKNSSRFEWFLEKATEIGVTEILPLICARTEKQKFKTERLQSILVSAMLQSQQTWLPQMSEPVKFADFIPSEKWRAIPQKLVAHCENQEKHPLQNFVGAAQTIILIGPEGDFNADEIEQALQVGYQPVSLGITRLRTETAGVVAASLLCL